MFLIQVFDAVVVIVSFALDIAYRYNKFFCVFQSDISLITTSL